MTAIAGTFVNVTAIASRKVARLSIEIPVEQVNQALEALGGYPDPANPQWVGIARLCASPNSNSDTQAPSSVTRDTQKPKRSWPEVPYAQQAGIVCNEPAFAKFASSGWPELWDNCGREPNEFARRWCKVKSRADLNLSDEAGRRWRDLDEKYRLWLDGAP